MIENNRSRFFLTIIGFVVSVMVLLLGLYYWRISKNVIEDNIFAAEGDGIAYGDEFEEHSRGNTIRNNKLTIDMTEFGYPENERINVTGVKVNADSRTVTVEY